MFRGAAERGLEDPGPGSRDHAARVRLPGRLWVPADWLPAQQIQRMPAERAPYPFSERRHRDRLSPRSGQLDPVTDERPGRSSASCSSHGRMVSSRSQVVASADVVAGFALVSVAS